MQFSITTSLDNNTLHATLFYNKGSNLVNQELRSEQKKKLHPRVVIEHWMPPMYSWVKRNTDT